MTVDGTWQLTITTPIGKQAATLQLTQDGDRVHGVATGHGEEVPLRELVLDGDRLTWAQSITKPMRLNLTFDVTVHDDQMTGTSKAGRLPTSKVLGRRTSRSTE